MLQTEQLIIETEQLVIETEQQVQKHSLFLLVPCLLCCCQVLLGFDYFVFDTANVLPDCLELTVHGT